MNAPKSRGTRWETAVVNYFNATPKLAEFFKAKRTGTADMDLADVRLGDHGEWLLECKDHAAITLPAFLDQLARSVARARIAPYKAAAVVKRRRSKGSTGSAGSAYVVMDLEAYRSLVLHTMVLETVLSTMTSQDWSLLDPASGAIEEAAGTEEAPVGD